MTRTWDARTFHIQLGKARAKARSWFRVDIRERDADLTPIMDFNGDRVIQMNGTRVAEIAPRDNCPTWAIQRFAGLRYHLERDYGGIHAKADIEADTLEPVVAAIIRREGYTGYVQGELPF